MNKANGGSAFPTVEANYHNENTRGDGLSVRDYMAIHASEDDVQYVMRAYTKQKMVVGEYRDCCSISRLQARYLHADAMLAERDK